MRKIQSGWKIIENIYMKIKSWRAHVMAMGSCEIKSKTKIVDRFGEKVLNVGKEIEIMPSDESS